MTLIGSYKVSFHRLPESLIGFSFSYDRDVVVKASKQKENV